MFALHFPRVSWIFHLFSPINLFRANELFEERTDRIFKKYRCEFNTMRIYIILTLRENEIVLAIINLATFAIEVPVTNFTK